ncbi:hypothetical protein LL266_16750 [Vibrio anguillarum]|uniref:hypothetical protein n=1 Tax=Vibrio anguillarum TaxID=55601 RepID=UPI001D196F44|nr:hypothetical protein [Vibrio anguillarum]MCC4238140.1 hypothetical protein [Vibrio anguillarum]
MSDFTAIGQYVTEAKSLLDSIKGGAIRTMQTQFEALKQTITTDGAKVVSDVDSLGRNKLQQLDSELASIKQNVDIQALGGQGRYVTEITVNGDKDTFYPVVFQMPEHDGDECEIQIYRYYGWNSSTGSEPSDFNATHVASALVVLRGQANPWHGNANYLRTLVNRQRYRQCVSNIGFAAYCVRGKLDLMGESNSENTALETYQGNKSGFMLRGGKLKYQIISNKPIQFSLLNDGDVIMSETRRNLKYTAKVLPVDSVEVGDSVNNHSISYISYPAPEVSA